MMQKFQNGAFVFYRTSSACQPMNTHSIEMLVNKHNLPSSLIPEYAGDRAIVARAISAVQPKATREHYLLRPIVANKSTEIVYGIVYEQKNQAQETLSHSFDSRLRWTSENGNGVHVEGDHPVAKQVDAQYQAWRGLIMHQDWSLTITNYLVNTCHGQAMRDDGRVYWIPPQNLQDLYALNAFLAEIGIALVVCEVEAESTSVVQQAASEGLADKLAELEREVDAFDGKQKPSTYKTRLQEYQDLRKRALTYRDALGIGVEQAQAMLDTLERKVSDLLTLRETVVVHRDGSQGHKGEKAPRKPKVSTSPIAQEQPWTAQDDKDYYGAPSTDASPESISEDTAIAAAITAAPIVGEWQGMPVVHIPEVLASEDPLADVMAEKLSKSRQEVLMPETIKAVEESAIVHAHGQTARSLGTQTYIPSSW
jgi:hypothetical protein